MNSFVFRQKKFAWWYPVLERKRTAKAEEGAMFTEVEAKKTELQMMKRRIEELGNTPAQFTCQLQSLKQDHNLKFPQLLEEVIDKLSTNVELDENVFVVSRQSQLRQLVGNDSFSLWLSSVAVCFSKMASVTGNLEKLLQPAELWWGRTP